MDLRDPSSLAELLAFGVFAAIAVLGALGTVLARNPIRSAVGLFFHILALGGLYLTLSAHFLAVIQLLVYAGAVVVLFVFVIMLLGPAAESPRDRKGLVPRVVSALAVGAAAAMILSQVGYVQRALVTRPPEFGTLWQVGHYLFNRAVLPFELISVLLVVAMIGAMAITRASTRRTLGDKDDDAAKKTPPGQPRLVAPLSPIQSTRDVKVVYDRPVGQPPEGHS